MRGIITVVLGVLVILGGVSGKFVFEEHTGGGRHFTMLMGGVLIVLGVVALLRSKK